MSDLPVDFCRNCPCCQGWFRCNECAEDDQCWICDMSGTNKCSDCVTLTTFDGYKVCEECGGLIYNLHGKCPNVEKNITSNVP